MTEFDDRDLSADSSRDPLTLPDSLQERSAPLPLPIRGTRYAVGAVLILVILTVVMATYRRIEQQLQLTLESRLTSVLSENVHTVTGWLKDRQALARKTAALAVVQKRVHRLVAPDPAPGETVGDESVPTFSTLIEVGLAKEIYLLRPDGSEGWSFGPSPPLVLEKSQLERLRKTGQAVYLDHRRDARRIVALSVVGSRSSPDAYLALTIDADAMTRGLQAARRQRSGESYAFDVFGYFGTPNGGTKAPSKDERALPPGARKGTESLEEHTTASIEEYVGLKGEKVIGSWAWLPENGFGIATEVPRARAYASVTILRQSFLVLVTLVGAAVLGFIALGRWTLRVREESLLMTRRLGRLARAIQPLSAALEHDPSAVVLVDVEGTVVYANAASHRVLGVNAPLLGQHADTVFENLHPELKSALVSGKDSIVAQGMESGDETLLVSSRRLRIDRTRHYLYMLRPITQQVRRQEVEHWKKLIRVLSHELNNALAPITSLLSSARALNQMSHQDARLGAIFESIAERTSHLVTFLEGYREVARLPRPDPRETQWELVLSGLESQKSFKRRGTLPEEPGYFDPIQLERVLVNVIKNAVEAGSSPEDTEVEVVKSGDGFCINVLDRGTGMPEAVLKQAMLPFFSTKRTGTGVGLALSREIIEAHGGQLTLANREGGGLIVSCYLPSAVTPLSLS